MNESRIETLLDQMTLAEQVSILSGQDFWSVPAIERLGIGKLRVTDGPNGARGGGSLINGVKSAAFPVGIAVGATWNPELVREIGGALADEVKSKGAHALLAPTVNIHRSVTNGRNFECYSEDPKLTADLAVAYVTGLQENGISATIKHFVGNESEIERTTMSSDVDERTLREIYLVPFEAAVKEAGTWAVMSSYNKLNGTYTAENKWLLTDVLRGDWGFDGVVMSDWFGSRSTAPTVNAGLDLEMPGPARDRGEKLIAAVEAGEVSAATVRERARNMLRLMIRTGAIDDRRAFKEEANDRPSTRALIRRAGAEASVLLKNDGALLPIKKDRKIALIGPNAKTAQVMGGGSAQLNPHYTVSPWQGMVDAMGEGQLSYAPGCTSHRWEPLLERECKVEFFDGTNLQGAVKHSETMPSAMAFWFPPFAGGHVDPANFSARITTDYTAERDGLHRFGLYSAGYSKLYVNGKLIANAWDGWKKGRTFFEEGCDEVIGETVLTAGETVQIVIEFRSKPSDNLVFSALRAGVGCPMGDAEIDQAAQTAANADVAVVFVGRSGEWDTEGSDLEHITLPGRQDDLVKAVLKANPNTVVVLQTGGPVEMPWIDQVKSVLQCWYPGQEAGNSIADVLLGLAEPTGRLPQTFPRRWRDNPTHSQDALIYPGLDGHVRYEEGVFVGYRHYDRHGIDPLFSFGHGLSYGRFEIENLNAATDGDVVKVSLTLRNTGKQDGTTVVQIYVGDPEASVARPEKELRAFRKCRVEAGETAELSFTLAKRDFAYFDVKAGHWRVEAGAFTISAGLSSRDLHAKVHLELGESQIAK